MNIITRKTITVSQSSRSVMSDSLWPHGLQNMTFPCPSPASGVCLDSCPLSWWCHPTISFSVIPFSHRLQSFPASRSFPVSQFFTSGGESIGVSVSASFQWIFRADFLYNGLVGSPCYSRDSQVFSNTTVQKHQFFSIQLSL